MVEEEETLLQVVRVLLVVLLVVVDQIQSLLLSVVHQIFNQVNQVILEHMVLVI